MYSKFTTDYFRKHDEIKTSEPVKSIEYNSFKKIFSVFQTNGEVLIFEKEDFRFVHKIDPINKKFNEKDEIMMKFSPKGEFLFIYYPKNDFIHIFDIEHLTSAKIIKRIFFSTRIDFITFNEFLMIISNSFIEIYPRELTDFTGRIFGEEKEHFCGFQMIDKNFIFFSFNPGFRSHDIKTMSLNFIKDAKSEKDIRLCKNGFSISRSFFEIHSRFGLDTIRSISIYKYGKSAIKKIFPIGDFIFSLTENDYFCIHDLETLSILKVYRTKKSKFSCFSSLGSEEIFLTGSVVSKNIDVWHFQKRNVDQMLKTKKLFDLNFSFEESIKVVAFESPAKVVPKQVEITKSRSPFIFLSIILILLAYLLKKIIEIKFY
jgi:hypothetical protein